MNIKNLPKARYITEIYCPECGLSGNNNEDISATFHEEIEELETEKGETYYHCTNCGCNFRP